MESELHSVKHEIHAYTLRASPRLKDADISNTKLPRLYGELLVAMRRMFHVCRLVHADLSEYNIL